MYVCIHVFACATSTYVDEPYAPAGARRHEGREGEVASDSFLLSDTIGLKLFECQKCMSLPAVLGVRNFPEGEKDATVAASVVESAPQIRH